MNTQPIQSEAALEGPSITDLETRGAPSPPAPLQSRGGSSVRAVCRSVLELGCGGYEGVHIAVPREKVGERQHGVACHLEIHATRAAHAHAAALRYASGVQRAAVQAAGREKGLSVHFSPGRWLKFWSEAEIPKVDLNTKLGILKL